MGPSRTVLHLISRLSVGGVENQLRLVCRGYDRSRFAPLVCCIREMGEIGREIEKEGTEVIALGRNTVHQFDPALVLHIGRLLQKRGIQILRTHQYEAGVYGRLAALGARTPVVVSSFHNIYRRRKWHRQQVNRILSRLTDCVVAVSECVRSDILRYDRLPAEKVKVIRNGIEEGQFQQDVRTEEIKATLGLPADSRIAGTVGRMTTQKGHVYLMEAVAALRRRMDLKLLIVGDGPLRHTLEAKAEDLGIAPHICFTGPRRDIYPLLRAMDVFVLPSLWEGMPTAIIEAMAAGRSVVASDIPPIREIIPSSELGTLVPPRDGESLRWALEELLEDRGRSERMGRSAREYALGNFRIEQTVSQYQDLFDAIAHAKAD